ncbi:MAG: ATP-binding protein [bacterium]
MDIEVVITRAAVFALVYGITFGLPFVVFYFFSQQVHSISQSYPWMIPIGLSGYAALSTITPFIYIRLERKVYYAFFGDFSSQLQVLRQTGREIIEKGFENAKEMARLIPEHIMDFYDRAMGQRVKHACYLLQRDGDFVLHRGHARCDKHKEGMVIKQEARIVQWFTDTRYQLMQGGIIKKKEKNSAVLDQERLDAWIQAISHKEKFKDLEEQLMHLKEDMKSLDVIVCVPSYYKDELMGILALGEKKGGSYRPEEIDAFQTLSENAAMVFKGAQLTASVVEAENIKHLEKAKSEFFANVSHELRTPLTNIILPIQKILDERGTLLAPDNVEEKKIMLKNAFQLLKRINEILDISKLESGKMGIQVRLRDMNSILADIVSRSSSAAKGMGIDLVFTQDDALSRVYVDGEKIEKVFANLMSNALKFTQHDGRVEVITKEAQDHIEISVRDTGIGIAEEDLPYIFDRFHQVDGSSSRRFAGTGIGLSLVKEFLKLHHGSIEVESELGKGTTFIAKLLKGKEHFQPDEIDETPEAIPGEGFIERRKGEDRRRTERREEDRRRTGFGGRNAINLAPLQFDDLMEGRDYSEIAGKSGEIPVDETKKSVLVVDDNRDLANNIAYCLRQEYNLFVEYNGKRALQRAHTAPVDIIISDVMMPEMDGIELCEKLKEDESTRYIPFILLTAKASVEEKIDGLEHGADEYLAKPFNVMELRAVVKSLLTQRELQARLNRSNQELKKALEELKEKEAEVIHVEKMRSLGEMLAGFAHEVNNPINYAKNCMYALRKNLIKVIEIYNQFILLCEERRVLMDQNQLHINEAREKSGKVTELIDFVEEGINRTVDLVGTLNNFSKKDVHSFQVVDIHEGINSTLLLLHNMLKHSVTLHKEYELEELVECIPGQINQVILNIIRNAAQSIGDKGDIWIKTYADGHSNAFISVRDNGEGIPDENLKKIFDPFYTTKDSQTGTGLGLSICYKIIKDHQGDIIVNNALSEGVEFIIRMPLRQVKTT